MKPSDLPFAGPEHTQLRNQLAYSITKVQTANKGGPTPGAQLLLALIDAAYLEVEPYASMQPAPVGVDDSTIVITPSATSFEASWDLPVQDPEAYAVEGWKINVRLNPSSPIIHTVTLAEDAESYTYNGPALTASTTYFFSVQGLYTENGNQYGTGLAGKNFTTAAA